MARAINTTTASEDLLSRGFDCFGTILADPPWQFTNRTGKMAPEHKRLLRYPTMDLEEIKELPVAKLALCRRAIFISGFQMHSYSKALR